ncbi:metal-dependent hydrolase [Salinilacihabitans rarus]|uniref:metal-dependent hydrolase n=1 Tax=Salinilacihabitans rarus TaxID=2961596 RepID=UPI0020C87D79|nr:metal-dependent hydrolase [Salinilacihabitans rarus]
MMLPTHALGGMLLAAPLLAVAPEFATVGLLAGLVGGVLPDLDMYVGHRKTLHYPVYYPALAAVAVPLAALAPSPPTVVAAFLLLGAAAHCVADVFGGGLELRPWEGTSDRAVYDHYRGRWIPPRRAIRYDGSPEDFLLTAAFAAPLLAALDGPLRVVVAAAVVVAGVYVALRRTLAAVAAALVAALPSSALSYVPNRYREAAGGR